MQSSVGVADSDSVVVVVVAAAAGRFVVWRRRIAQADPRQRVGKSDQRRQTPVNDDPTVRHQARDVGGAVACDRVGIARIQARVDAYWAGVDGGA